MNAHKYRVTAVLLLMALLLLAPSVVAAAPAVEKPADTTAWSGFYYEYVAGSALRPRGSQTTWASSGSGGCIYANANAWEVFNVPLSLPQGSRIDYLRIYYYDSSASNSIAWVTVYNGAAGISDLTHVYSAGSSGYGTQLSGYLGHVVDNYSRPYVLNWRPVQAGSSMMLCGLRVAYRLPY